MNDQEIFEEIKEKLLTHLGDSDKVEVWLNCTNGNFGYCKPIDLIRLGRANKVLLAINALLEGY